MIYTEAQVYRVLESIGLDVESEVGDDLIVYCPYHNNHRTPAGEVSKERGVFYCFSCNTAAPLERLVMKVTGRTFFEAMRLIKSKEVDSSIVDQVSKAFDKKPDFVMFDELLVARLNQAANNSDRAQKYLRYRDIAQSINTHSLGYSESQDMVTVLVHSPDGMLLGFVARSIEGKEFKNSPGLPKSKTLFNIHRVKSKPFVFVVESSFDALRLSQQGIPAVATLGAGVSKAQIKLLDQYFNSVYAIPDADAAGAEMVEKLKKGLGSKVVSINLPTGAKDVGDLTNDQITKLRGYMDNPLIGVL
jgi:DNA primase